MKLFEILDEKIQFQRNLSRQKGQNLFNLLELNFALRSGTMFNGTDTQRASVDVSVRH